MMPLVVERRMRENSANGDYFNIREFGDKDAVVDKVDSNVE
jgi:hypothetical protein